MRRSLLALTLGLLLVGGKAVSLNSTNSIVLNQWQHVAVTWDGTSTAHSSTPAQ